jgi:hypothetical protein
MLETLIQQSPLSGTELEIAYRHELTLDIDSEDFRYWLVTRKSDGARLWLKAAGDTGRRKKLADECRLLSHLQCPGLAGVEVDGTTATEPYIGFRYLGEVPSTLGGLADFSPMELLAFSLSVTRLIHSLETSKPPTALLQFDSAPLLVSPTLKRPKLLGLGSYVQTASKEPHRQARESAWQVVAAALAFAPDVTDAASLVKQGEQWVARGPEAYDSLHQAFNATAFKVLTQDL